MKVYWTKFFKKQTTNVSTLDLNVLYLTEGYVARSIPTKVVGSY